MRRQPIGALLGLLLVLGACGGEPEGVAIDRSTPAGGNSAAPVVLSPGATPASAAVQRNELPEAVVRDVNTAEDVNVRSLVPAAKPLLFWFFTPS